jgi:hypothetical protein
LGETVFGPFLKETQMQKTASTTKKWLDAHGHWAHFTHRDNMARKTPMAKASLPKAVPATTLPVDCTGNATVSCPMLGNDQYGDCGPVMCAHVNQIRTYGQGNAGFTEVSVNQAALVAQYEKVSGGDNGTDEDMLVGTSGIWITGIANDTTQTVVDHLDVDVTDVALTQYCLDQFYAVEMAWSVPDDFLQKFATGTVWPSADTPDPNNGHYTPLADVGGPTTVSGSTNLNGFYRLWTWGTWCWVSPAFIASVQPQSFVTFSALQFNSTGYDSHGRHVSDQAAAWVALGGDATKVSAVVAKFPPKPAPGPTPAPPAPAPTPAPTVAPTLAQVESALNTALASHPTALNLAISAVTPLW